MLAFLGCGAACQLRSGYTLSLAALYYQRVERCCDCKRSIRLVDAEMFSTLTAHEHDKLVKEAIGLQHSLVSPCSLHGSFANVCSIGVKPINQCDTSLTTPGETAL